LLTRAGAKKDAKRLVITTIVSSPMLGVIARKLGVAYEETLTGFKWIASRALELAQTEQREFVFGYEEALGYTVSTLVRDKDGVSAAVVFADLVASLRARNTTVLAELEELARRYGLFVSEQVSVTRKGADGVAAIKRMMSRLRSDAPKRIGPLDVVALRDYQARVRTDLATGATQPLTLPVSDVITLDFAGGSRIIARPSGTEPKIKFYIDVCEPIAAGELVEAARARATVTLAALKDDFRTRYGN
jgi:phosphomannomutase